MITITNGMEWELDSSGKRTGRWRRRQFYGRLNDQRVPSERVLCEWREAAPVREGVFTR